MANNAASVSGLGQLEERVASDMQKLAYPARQWVCPRTHPSGAHVYEVAIIGGGQCGLTTSFGLIREQVNNVIVLDENPEGLEGPWATYARMVTLRTNKALTGPDLGVPSLTFQSYYEAKYGEAAWLALDKIPKEEWMAYLVWYRRVLSLPVRNTTKVDMIVPEPETGLLRLQLVDTKTGAKSEIITRKVVLATGIQGGGEWHVPAFIKESVPRALYAHTSEAIDFEALKGKRVAILGGGASAFDNAQYGLEREVGEVHVFVRRPELPRINPIRFMEFSAFLRHFSDLDDATKYAGIDFFLQFNQPPTNDTFNRACKFPNFHLHTGAPWEKLETVGDKVRIHTPNGAVEGLFDFLIVSTGLMTDCNLRPELRCFAGDIATWQDKFKVPQGQHRNCLIDCHPYLGPSFEFLEKVPGEAPHLRSIFAFNYSALASLGLSASALSGMKYAMPKLVGGITRQLFLDDQSTIIGNFLSYNVEEFVGQWPQPVAASGPGAPTCGSHANGDAAAAPAAKLLRTA